MMYNYVIIEDEKGAYNSLKLALKSKTKYVHKGYATNVHEGILLIIKHKPDLIFLDVELGEESGFDLIKDLKNSFLHLPPIIMTTAHDKYAKNAVNNQVLYFLSKPIDISELHKALLVFENKNAETQEHIFIRNGNVLDLIKFDEIIYLQADEGYTTIFIENHKKDSVPKTLKYFETKLNKDFLRIHRSNIINITKIKEIKLTERLVVLDGKNKPIEVEIGRNYVQKLRNTLKI